MMLAFPTSSLFSNETVSTKSFTANLTTSTLPHSSGTILYNDTYTTTIGLSSGFTSSFASFTGTATSTGTEDNGSVTGFGFGTSTDGSGSGSTATGDSSSPSSTSTDVSGSGSGSSSSSTSAGTVAGSVLGAVAGIGLILIAALMLLRYKKRQRGLRLSDTNGLPGTRGLVLGGGGDGPSGGSPGMGDMSEGRSVPFMVPAALANLTGYKRNSQRTASSEGTERGFHKVSGRKLPSVLQHGGDGYSDPTSAANPRDTMMTDQSFYRDSQGYYTGPDIPRLAVGSPMRPESGVPVFHPGPGRTPVTASAYFGSNLEPPRKDPLGRSLASQDGSRVSRGSGSRFTEEI
ncbi:hypothetical protein BKA67DRAFT_226070 [Truncatella angustata]|uniref:Uncharacterized protein n=1 Tax=Truncatella angustata TaxID=152316 RepID=A0A9P8UN94_9PEZI|nr:uncharacterized protein BKA67DRAFT_226070 [Truncatella angustata]KAH6655091.1 hypothetical protein BKA67DRAFT_226070 [Truncatella angustata]